MARSRTRRWWSASIIGVLGVALILFWQRETIARFAIAAAAEAFAQVHVSFGTAQIGLAHSRFDDVRVTSLRGEPIASIPILDVAYNLRDLLPGGRRAFGLKSVEAQSPQITIIRRTDGTFNIPVPRRQPGAKPGPPLIVDARVSDGSIEVINQSRYALAGQQQLYARNLQVAAKISSAARSTYHVSLRYGERPDRLYSVSGRGTIDYPGGIINHHWTAAQLPIAGAINFVVDSPALRLLAGRLQNVDARLFGTRGSNGALQSHLAATAALRDGRVTIAGLSTPIEGIRGPVYVYENGVLTSGLHAEIAGVSVSADGGLYGLTDPRLRVAVRGNGDLARLRAVFPQAHHLPIRGPLAFALLVEGEPKQPALWIALHSPQTTYSGTTVHDLDGVVAFDGHQADVIRFGGAYGRVSFDARGRVALQKERNAIQLLVAAHAPPGAAPEVGELLPQTPLNVAALATATNPNAIAIRGALWGAGGAQSLSSTFDVDARGNGTIGPLIARSGGGSLYARVALNHTGGTSVGLIDARNFPLPIADGTLSATFAGSQTRAGGIGAGGVAQLDSTLGTATAYATVAMHKDQLSGRVFGDVGTLASFGATVGGTLGAPRAAGAVIVAGGRYRNFDVNGNAGLAYRDGTLDVNDAAVAIGPLFVGVAGTVAGLSPHGTFRPQYDLATQVHSANVSALVAAVAPEKAPLVQGSIDADLRVRGKGAAASFAGRVNAPEGSVNGLSFRDFAGVVDGNTNEVAVSAARVVVGSSPIDLSAKASRAGAAHIAIDAPRLDLADFNDFFDTGDMFAGTGSLVLRANLAGTHLLASSGNARFSNAKFRRIEFGTVAADWSRVGDSIATGLRVGGPMGELTLNGTIDPTSRNLNVGADARAVDLSKWLPILGYMVPVTGRLDAETTLAGIFPDLTMRVHAAVSNGTAGRIPIERFEVTASARNGRGTIESAVLDVPSLTTAISGRFGLRATDPLGLVATSTSENVGDFLTHATGRDFGLTAALSSSLHIDGTRTAPRLRDTLALQNVRYHELTIPRIAGEIDVDRHSVAVRNGEVDLEHGRALLAATLPIILSGTHVAPGSGPISGFLVADGVELSNVAGLLPEGTKISGRIDGRVNAEGTAALPNLNGTLTLADGAFNGPMERSPITGIAGTLAFNGMKAQLDSRASVGSGSLTARGTMSLADLQRPANAAFTFNAEATNARFDLPSYFQGTVNGTLAMERSAGTLPSLSGALTISQARVPLTAFIGFGNAGSSRPALPNVAFDDLQVAVGNDVRVQNANVDIGAAGGVQLGGSLEAPRLTGEFRSTGGSLSFFRSFNIQRGVVTFPSSGGLMPSVDAVATTFVANPPTAVSLHVTGPASNMNLALASEPPYSREQILGLLVGAQQFGAVQGVQATRGTPFSATATATNLAFGQLNTVFTRNLLEPISTSVGRALGFTEVQITSDLQTGLGVNAVKAFGRYVSAIFSQTFGYPRTASIALEAHPNDSTGLRLTAFNSFGPTIFALQQPQPVTAAGVGNVNPATSFTPIGGESGVSFLYLRRWW
jgi:hypothetical protein